MESNEIINPSQSPESCSWRTAAGDCSAAAAFVSTMLPAQPSPSLPSLSRNRFSAGSALAVSLHLDLMAAGSRPSRGCALTAGREILGTHSGPDSFAEHDRQTKNRARSSSYCLRRICVQLTG